MVWKREEHDPEWPFDLFATDFTLDPQSTALLVIDLQSGDLRQETMSELAKKYPTVAQYWQDRIENYVIPNTERLIKYFRKQQMKVVYTRNGSMTSSCAELSERLRQKAWALYPEAKRHRGTPGYEIHQRLSPQCDELVVDKLTSGAFTGTCLDHALRNMGITCVVIVGIVTDMCVFGTARTASELGYKTLICEDACAAYTARSHLDALLMHARVFGRVATTTELMRELDGN
jgi:nicotinamidase-related amidase